MPEVQKISMDEFISEYKPIKNDNGGWTHKSAEASQMLPIFVWTLVDSIWSVAPVAVPGFRPGGYCYYITTYHWDTIYIMVMCHG